MTIQELKQSLTDKSYEEAIKLLSSFIDAHPESDEAYTLRGMRHWGAGRRALAINDYLAAIKINPDSRAAQALKATNSILDYRNKDLYNP